MLTNTLKNEIKELSNEGLIVINNMDIWLL